MRFAGWFFLTGSSLLNVAWLVSLRQTEGFQRLVPLAVTAGFGLASSYLLSRSLLVLPASSVYAVYMGLTVAGSVGFDALLLRQGLGTAQIAFMLLILVGTIGLQALTPAGR